MTCAKLRMRENKINYVFWGKNFLNVVMKQLLSFLLVVFVALIPLGLAFLNEDRFDSERNSKTKIECKESVCAIQHTSLNDPIEFEALVFNPKTLNDEPIKNSFASSVVRIYYQDEKKEKVFIVTVKNGNVMTSLSFDDVGMIQVVTSKLLGYEPFFFLTKNDSGNYRLEETRKKTEDHSDSLCFVRNVLRQPNPKSHYGQMSDKFRDSAFQKEIDSVLRKLDMLK